MSGQQEREEDEREVEFVIDNDGYYLCPECKTDDAIYIDACHDGGGESLPGWNIWCESCNVYEIVESQPYLRDD